MFFLLNNLVRQFFSRKVRYWILAFQNNNELRSTGGYITQVLEVRVGGFGFGVRFLDVNTDLKHDRDEKPPREMEKYLKVNSVQFRDANFDPEFESSARRMIRLYLYDFPDNKVAGVVAVNFSVIEDVLGVIGKIADSGGKTWTKENIFYGVSTRVSDIDFHDLSERKNRKNVLRELFTAIIKKCVYSFWRWGRLRKLFYRSVTERAVQLFFADGALQKKLVSKNLYLPFSPGTARDWLSVIDNNYLGVKSNRYIRRTVKHDVLFHLEKSALTAPSIKSTITLEHLGERNYPLSHTYQSWLSVYLPLYAELKNIATANGEKVEFDQSEHNSFLKIGTHILIRPREKMDIVIEYSLPANLFKDGTYSFKFIKQSGVFNESVFNSVKFPDQYMIAEVAECDALKHCSIRENLLVADCADCGSDFLIQVKANLHKEPPRVYYHEIIGPQTIEIRFNEPVLPDADVKKSIIITDRHTKLKVHANGVEFFDGNRTMQIHTKDLPETGGAFYLVELKNIRNFAGNGLVGNQKKMTVVYRLKQFRNFN